MTVFLAALLTACSGDAPAEKPETPEVAAEAKSDDHGHDHGEHGDDAGKPVRAPEGAKVMFLSPAPDATVKSPLKIEMGVEGMKVQPAGELVEGTGHHHILIDTEPVDFGEAVPADEQHIHFGKGQTETEIELTPGKHTLVLQFADGAHRSYGKELRAQIVVLVEE